MLAVVRLGWDQDAAVLDWALSLRSEHRCAVSVVGVVSASMWLCLASLSPTCLATVLTDERLDAEILWYERCTAAGVQLRFAGFSAVSPTVDVELASGRHAYLVVAGAALSPRGARRLCRRHPGLQVMRV